MKEDAKTNDARQEAAAILEFKRKGNPYVKTEFLRRRMKEIGIRPEELGTTEEELRAFEVQDCRWQLESDLINWRLTNGIGDPESCFAKGIVEALRQGGLSHEEFGITDIELGQIKRCAGG